MLFDHNSNAVNREPHRDDYNAWRERISDQDFEAMRQAINDFCDTNGEFQSSFMPGQSPAIQALFPALTAACGGNEEHAGWFFGNIVWRVLCDRTGENWYFTRPERDPDNPLGKFYWRR